MLVSGLTLAWASLALALPAGPQSDENRIAEIVQRYRERESALVSLGCRWRTSLQGNPRRDMVVSITPAGLVQDEPAATPEGGRRVTVHTPDPVFFARKAIHEHAPSDEGGRPELTIIDKPFRVFMSYHPMQMFGVRYSPDTPQTIADLLENPAGPIRTELNGDTLLLTVPLGEEARPVAGKTRLAFDAQAPYRLRWAQRLPGPGKRLLRHEITSYGPDRQGLWMPAGGRLMVQQSADRPWEENVVIKVSDVTLSPTLRPSQFASLETDEQVGLDNRITGETRVAARRSRRLLADIDENTAVAKAVEQAPVSEDELPVDARPRSSVGWWSMVVMISAVAVGIGTLVLRRRQDA